MCARDVTTVPPEDPIWEDLGIVPMSVEAENYPGRDRLVVRPTPAGPLESVSMRWGLVPSWTKEPHSVKGTFNARSEGILERPTYRAAYRSRRCLLLGTGFIEWRSEGGRKVPYLFTVDDGRAYAYAGLWEQWGEGDSALLSCTLITTGPNDLVAEYHNRMPAILRPEDYCHWVDPRTPVGELPALLAPFPGERMAAEPFNCGSEEQGSFDL